MAVSVQAQFTISLNLPGPLEIVLDSPSFRLTSPSELEHVGAQRGPGILKHSVRRMPEASFGEGLPAWVGLCFQGVG